MKLEYIALFFSVLTPSLLFLFKNYILNYFKGLFDKDIEKFKHDLEINKEIFKQELSREALKSVSLFNVRQILYPEIFEKIQIAQGCTLGLMGVRYSLTFDDYSENDFKRFFQQNDFLTDKTKDSFFQLLSNDPAGAIKKLHLWLREKEFSDCKVKQLELKNHLILKQLYISQNILDLCFEIHKLLVSYSIDVEYEDKLLKGYDHFKKIEVQITEKGSLLSTLMRNEIFGET